MRVGVLVWLIVVAIAKADAQPPTLPANPRGISLQECIDLALTRNLDLQIERRSGDIARYDLSSAFGVYMPNFSFSAREDYLSQSSDFDPKKAGLDFPYKMRTETVSGALDGRLPFGLSYDFTGLSGQKSAHTDFNSNTNTARDFLWGVRNTNNYFADAGATFRQHLLKDFWTDLEWQTVLIRRKNIKISNQMLRLQIMKTVLAVELGYYDLVAARERIRVAEQAVELKQQLEAEMKRRVEVGDLPPLEGEQAQTQLQNALLGLSLARDDFFDRQSSLKNLFTDSFEAWANLELDPVDRLEANAVALDRSASFRKALEQRPDLKEARLLVEKSDVVVQFRMNQLFPALDLIGHYGEQTVDAKSAGGAMDEALRFRDPNYFYGVVIAFPLNNLAERANYRASKAARDIAELQLKKAEQEILVQVAVWVHRVESRLVQVSYARKARSFAESALAAEEKKLQNGLSTAFVVLQLQGTVTAARNAEIQALADYNYAVAQLAFAEGSTMEKHHISLQVK
jgi:outer membrane protein TolC